jgi:hypothetical protein
LLALSYYIKDKNVVAFATINFFCKKGGKNKSSKLMPKDSYMEISDNHPSLMDKKPKKSA